MEHVYGSVGHVVPKLGEEILGANIKVGIWWLKKDADGYNVNLLFTAGV